MTDYDTMTGDDMRKLGAKWADRLRAAEKREKDWAKDAEEAETAYLSDRESHGRGKVYDFNILHSNIETMVPAVFNSAPVPDVRERFRTGPSNEETSAAYQVARVIERAIAVQVDDGALEREMAALTQDALLPGRGVIRIRFDADPAEMPMTDPMGQPMLDEMGMPVVQQVLTNERIVFEAVGWRNFRAGPATRWENVPWVAFRHCLPWEQVDAMQDEAIKQKLAAGEARPEIEADADTYIWEIWCRETGKVYMLVEASSEVLSVSEDPMGLASFFPVARPVQPISVTDSLCPVVPFKVYKRLADELEAITKRISAITDGLKVRGLFVGSVADIENLAQAGDNTLVPVANVEGFAATGGLEKAIAWWPIDRAITVLRELYGAREQTKAMIYEVTGISDIVRGQGNANETATAQEIKSQWGSLRIRKLQKQIEGCAREVFILCAQVISSKFSPQTLGRMTGIEISEEIASMLNSPLDHYRIDVESDSTVRSDLSRRKGEMGEFLQGTAQFFSTMAPLVQQDRNFAPLAAEIYGSFARQFNLGKQVEDALEQMTQLAKQAGQQPAQEGPTPEQMKAQADMQAKEAELALKREEMQMKSGLDREKRQIEVQKMQADLMLAREKMQMDMAGKQAEIQLKREGKGAETMVKVGNNDDDIVGGVMQGLAVLMEALQQGQAVQAQAAGEQTAALVQEIQRGNAMVVSAMMAPKELVRDQAGKPVGVRTVVN
jgi:hypothetical protein